MINSRYDGILHKETSPRTMEGFFVVFCHLCALKIVSLQ